MGTQSPLSMKPPLRRVSSFLSEPSISKSVSVRLGEPMWRASKRVDFLAQCMQMQVLLEAATATAGGSGLYGLTAESLCASNIRIHTLMQTMYATAGSLLGGDQAPGRLLEAPGMVSLCPLVASLFGEWNADYSSKGVSKAHAVYESMAALNQLLVIATELRKDVDAGLYKRGAACSTEAPTEAYAMGRM